MSLENSVINIEKKVKSEWETLENSVNTYTAKKVSEAMARPTSNSKIDKNKY